MDAECNLLKACEQARVALHDGNFLPLISLQANAMQSSTHIM